MSDDRLLDAIRLNSVAGVGPRLQMLLLERFGSPAAVLSASGTDLLEVPGVGAKLSVEITKARNSDVAETELRRCEELGITPLLQDDDRYPGPLREICDPPQVLYSRGELQPCDSLAIAIVGTRRCTHYGRQQAERFAAALARAGFTIVSGLARGIDGAAHRAALGAGGRTLAVFGTGLGSIYPPEHRVLADEVARHGALLSEAPVDRGPTRGVFPQRNRIIAGLCRGVIIVEAGRQSGSLHTARHALEQGREVFAIPGQIDNPECHGCLDLIRDGVTLARSVDDVLEELGPLPSPVQVDADNVVLTPRELVLNEQERAVLGAIETQPQPVDLILSRVELETSRVLATLTALEMRRLVKRLPGGLIMRVSH
ncbi:MAG: DNA-processing protein DprA [Planctomycetaceae bacterium]